MTSPESFAFAESFVPESAEIAQARANAEQVGAVALGSGAGAALAFLAGAVGAKNVVEIGTGAGVSGLWLFTALAENGVLTSVDLEAENQRLARQSFTAAGIASNRIRLIPGAALDVLPRLSDAAYDLVFVDADKTEYGEYYDEALRLVRTGGLIVFDNTLWHDRVADPAHRDPETTSIRALLERVAEDEGVRAVLLAAGDGLLAVQKR